jgi:hypothetical protein
MAQRVIITVDQFEEFLALPENRDRNFELIDGEIIEKIGHISYWYFINEDRVKVHKMVHFFLLKYIKGDTGDHDHEVDEARWFQIDEAIETLSYRSEKQIVQKAKGMIEGLGEEELKLLA